MIFKDRKLQLGSLARKRSGFSSDRKEWGSRNFLTIAPALPVISGIGKCSQRATSSFALSRNNKGLTSESSDLEMAPHDMVYLQVTSDGKVQATRSQKDKEKNPEQICLDRRGLTHLPNFIGEKNIKILSLQHNLISRIDGFSNLGMNKLVFLDLYNNQLETIAGLESFENLRVLLIGKNRLKKIGGIKSLTKLEILDLHGNQINQISALSTLCELKILNLAGNQIRVVEDNSLEGLLSLQELNLKRNRLRRISDLTGPPRLEKLFLSNNEISSIDDMSGICKVPSLKEITIDGNPISMTNDCVHLLVSYLPNLQVLSHMQVTEQVRKSSILWRKNRENLMKAIATEVKDGAKEASRVEVISNAKTNWELLRKRAKCLPSAFMTSSLRDLRAIEECDVTADKTIQSDSVLSVASSITLSSRDSLPTSRAPPGKKTRTPKRSHSEEASDVNASLDTVEYFKLPPILASLAKDREREKTAKNGNSSEKNEGFSSETSEATGEQATESENDESENFDEKQKDPDTHSKSCHQNRKICGKKERNLTGKAKAKFQGPAPGKLREQGGDYLIEICGRCLNVYGQGALRFIDRPWNPVKAADVTTVRFNYVSFGGISNILSKLKQRFPNAENFVFRETNISHLGQLNALADVQGLSSLQIDEEGNPINEKNWRNYAIYRLAHWGLNKINGREITELDLAEVSREFQGLSDLVMWSLPESLLQPLLSRLRIEGGRSSSQQSARQWLWNADPALRSVVCKEALQWRRGTQDDLCWRHKGKTHFNHMVELTCLAVDKLQIFESRWPTLLNQLIRDTLVDYSQMDSYMKKCIQQLQ